VGAEVGASVGVMGAGVVDAMQGWGQLLYTKCKTPWKASKLDDGWSPQYSSGCK